MSNVISIFTGKPVDPAALALGPTPARKQSAVKTAPKAAPRKRGGLGREIQKAMLAKVHVARQRLGLDDETYRGVLRERFGVESSAELDRRGLDGLLDHLQRLGFEPRPRRKVADPHDIDRQIRKIEALLAEKGRIEGTDVPWGYAMAILKRQAGKSRFQDATAEELRGVITALIRDAKRHGRRVV